MEFQDWLRTVPESLKRDPLWGFHIYPKALYLSDLAWQDTDAMMKDLRGREVASQLVRSVGSVCANLEEGHGRGFGKENAHFQRIALGSAREARGWYYRSQRFLGPEVIAQRMRLLDEIVASLVLASQTQREHRK